MTWPAATVAARLQRPGWMYIHCSDTLLGRGDPIRRASETGNSVTYPAGSGLPVGKYDDTYVYIWDAPSLRDITGGAWSDYHYRYIVLPDGQVSPDPQFGNGPGGAAFRCRRAVVLERHDWHAIRGY
jgi:hypothetical protein